MKLMKIIFMVPLKNRCINLPLLGEIIVWFKEICCLKEGWFFPSIPSLSLSCFISITVDC